MVDMMQYEVVGQGDAARFLITHPGARLAETYGNERVDSTAHPHRFLDDAIGPERYANVIELYRACLTHLRPAYSISTVQDADGKDVSYERLLLPAGFSARVEQIVGLFKAISVEGGFKVTNLMALQSRRIPVRVIDAVIDREISAEPSGRRATDDVVEAS